MTHLVLSMFVLLAAVHDFQLARFEVQSLFLPVPALRRSSSALRTLRMGFDTVVRVSSRYEAPCAMACDGGVSLTDYMQLPVDQYVCIKMPLDATLERVSGTRFNMTVPPVRFFNLDVSPTVMCDVTQSDDCVRIVSDECILRGSPYVVGLNGCFRMRIVSEFRWTDTSERRAISSASDIHVEVDPPPPFKYFGKTIMEKTGKLALSIALSQIENAFVQSLARDYERWATDKSYRITRAGNSCDICEDLEPAAATATSTATSSTAATVEAEPPAADIADESAEEDIILVENVVTKESPPVLTDDICLLPGSDPIVRVEEAPSNSRRIFTGVDIMAPMDAVWDVLTAYERLQDVVPSLVRNRVLARTPDGGARLAQVGGAKVLPGVTFTAKTVLDVRIYTEDNPLPDSMLADCLPDRASSAEVRAHGIALPLRRDVFPRPFSLTSLPCRDITMQNVAGEGDFEHYQGVWRMQSLPNCNPTGGSAARLTYAVEIKPKGMLPVRLIEGRIAADLKANMASIRDFVEAREERKQKEKDVRAVAKAATLVEPEPLGASVDVAEAPVLDPESSSLLVAIRRGAAAARSDEELAREAAQILAQAQEQAQAALAPAASHAAVEAGSSLSTAVGEASAAIEPAAAPIDVDPQPPASGSFFRNAVRRLFGPFRRGSGAAGNANAPHALAPAAPGPEDETASSPDGEALAVENAQLRARVAFLEGEIAAARDVLQQIGSSSRRDA